MHLLAKEEYGLRCMLQVAHHHGGADQSLTIPQVALAEGLSTDYVAQLMRALRRGGLLTSTRGAGGGYKLAREASAITVWEVIEVLGGTFFPESFCEEHPGRRRDCVRSADCAVRALWQKVEATVRSLLAGITLADMQASEVDVLYMLTSRDGSTLPAEVREEA
jgi:Rrf2 family iron-sulfur cluster assembly transcriptional regulator